MLDGQFANVNTELNSVQPQKTENNSNQEDKRILSNITSTVQFNDIYPDVDLEYITRPEDIKETLIIKNRIEEPIFKFEINTKNLIATLKENNTIAFYDINDNTKEVFLMDAPYMVDDNNVFSDAIEVTLEETNNGYTLTLKPSAEWLNSPDRAYPVKIEV